MLKIVAVVLGTLVLALPLSATAWKGAMVAGARNVAEVQAKAESGDYVTVQGRIVNVEIGSGSRYIVTLEDDTGAVPVRVPEHLRRHFGEGNTPQTGGFVRVSGKWTHAYMDQETWGIHAQKVEFLEN